MAIFFISDEWTDNNITDDFVSKLTLSSDAHWYAKERSCVRTE